MKNPTDTTYISHLHAFLFCPLDTEKGFMSKHFVSLAVLLLNAELEPRLFFLLD